jgi:hypothetical protein
VFYHPSPQSTAEMICAIGCAIVSILAVLMVASTAQATKNKNLVVVMFINPKTQVQANEPQGSPQSNSCVW